MALDSATFNNLAALKDSKTDSDTGITVDTYYDATTFEIIGVENKDAGGNTTFKSTKTEDTTGYSAAADVAANAALNLNGDKAAGGKVTNTTAEKVSITSAGNDSNIFYDVTGKNAAGEVVTERVAGANDGTAQTTAAFLEVTEVKAVGTPADKVSLAGEGYTEVVEQTETRKEPNADGVVVDVTFKVEKTINYDGGAKIKSGTEKIDGKEKTLGENGIVTAETMDTDLLGDALAGDALAAVVDRYDSVVANATIYSDVENLGGGTTVTTLYAADKTIVGSSDTSVETFGDMTITVTNHFAAPVTSDAAGEYIGTSGTDGTNTWSYSKTEVTTDSGMTYDATFTDTPAIKETGSESYGGETREFTYFFDKATGELLSGTEVVGGITTTFGANWAITAEKIDTSDLGEALASSVLDDLPASVVAASGNTYSITETFEWGGGETTYFNAQGVTTGFAYTWADASGNSNNSYYDANDNYVGDSWSDAEGRSGSSSVVIAINGSKVETGKYADTKNSSDDSSWVYEYNSEGVLTKSTDIRGKTTTVTENGTTTTAFATTGLDTLNLGNVGTDIKNAFFTGMTTVYTSTETFAWGGSLMTFIHADGSIIGYADSYSDDWDGDGTEDSSGTTYMDFNWDYVGSAWSDSWGNGERFETKKDKDGNALASGFKREFGEEYWADGQGGQSSRKYDYTFDNNGNLQSGEETGSDGITTIYGANWEIVSQKGDVSALGDALTTAELAGVPTSIQSSLDNAQTYAKSTVYDWGTDITYYDSTGAILGYANSSSWDNAEGGKNTNKGYHDANWNWLGGSWADLDANGATIRSGSNSTVDGRAAGDDDGISVAAAVADDALLVIGGALALGGSVTNAVSHQVTITSSGNDSAIKFTVSGTDASGAAMTEIVSGANAGTSNSIGFFKTITSITAVGDPTGTVSAGTGLSLRTSFVDSGSYREGDEGSTYSWTFNVTYDSNGFENHEMAGGTEVRGTYNDAGTLVGTTYTYGANWALEGAKADTSNLATLDLSTLDASLVTALFGSADAVIKYSTEQFDWNEGFSQSTYYDELSGDIVGYSDSWSDDWDGDGEVDSSGQSYMDENWDYVGGSWSDAYGSGHNFTIKTVVNNEITEIREIGENTWKDYDGTSQTNKFDLTYDGNWNLLSGTEERGQKGADGTLSGGEKITYGENWEILSVSRDVNLSSDKIAELTDAQLDDIPSALHAASGKTYTETEVNPWGTQVTYLDSNGKILGYSDAWSEEWGSGTNFQDADWNHLGSTYDDQWSTGFHHTVESTLNGEKVYIETGKRTDKNEDGSLGEVTTNEFIFDENWNMISGTEIRGATTTTFGANWVIESQATSMLDVQGVNVTLLPDAVKTLLFTGETLTSVKALTEDFPWGGSQTTYFDGSGNVLGYMDTYSNVDANGAVESSGTSFMDANWNHIGGTYSDEWGSGSNFSVETVNATGISVAATVATDQALVIGGALASSGSVTNTVAQKVTISSAGDDSGISFTVVGTDSGGNALTEIVMGANAGTAMSSSLFLTIASITSVGTAAGNVSAGTAQIVDSGTSTWTNYLNEVEEREFEFTFNHDYSLISGQETSSDGTTTIFGANWEKLDSKVSMDNVVPLTSAELGAIKASPLKATSDFSESAQVGNDEALTLGGSLAGSGAVTNTSAQKVTITSAGDDSGMTFDIVGTDANGAALLETVSGANAGTATSQGLFLTITSIKAVGDPSGVVSAGGETFSKVSPWGETTYFDANGTILGYYSSWSDDYGNGSNTGENYSDANWNSLGGSQTEKDADGNVIFSSSTVRVKNADGTETEIGSFAFKDGDTLVQSSHIFNFDAAGDMTGGSRVEPDGTIVTLGANWTFMGEAIDPSNATALVDTSGIPVALLSGLIDGITKYIDPPAGDTQSTGGTQFPGGTMAGNDSGGPSMRTFLDSNGTVLGYQETHSAPWGTEVIFLDANHNRLGSSSSDGFMKSTTVSTDIIDADGISTAATVADNGSLVLNGALAVNGQVFNYNAQKILILSAGNDADIKFTITGTDYYGNLVTDDVSGANAGTATSAIEFATVTGITAVGEPAGNVSVGTKTGSTETTTETEKNINGSDGAEQYTGLERVVVRQLDSDGFLVTETTTKLMEDGTKKQFVFDGNQQVIGEYTYELKTGMNHSSNLETNYNKIVSDKYGLFQLEKFEFKDEYMKGFAKDQGTTSFGVNSDGTIDAFTADYNNDGVADLVYNFGQAIFDGTVFAGPPSSIDMEMTAAANPVPVSPAKMLGLTFEANGLKMVWRGDFTLIDNPTDTGGSDNVQSGTVTEIYIYDTANSTTAKPAVIGHATSLSMNFNDVKTFMDSLPGAPAYQDGPAFGVFNIGGSGAPGSPSFVPGMDFAALSAETAGDHNLITLVNPELKLALTDAGYGSSNVDEAITPLMITLLLSHNGTPFTPGTTYAAYEDEEQTEETTQTADFVDLLSGTSYVGSVTQGLSITTDMIIHLKMAEDSNYVPPLIPRNLADLMGGSLTEVTSDLAPTELAMGGAKIIDELGNSVQRLDDGAGNFTEIMVDPNDPNIEIMTEFLAGGGIKVTELRTDPVTGIQTPVLVGSGEKVEETYYDQMTFVQDGVNVVERDYDMANVYNKIETGPAGERTELGQDARGVEVKTDFNINVETGLRVDNSFKEVTTSADGRTVVTRDVDADGVATIRTVMTPTDGSPREINTKSGNSSFSPDGARTDVTYNNDGSSIQITYGLDGVETWLNFNSDMVETSRSTRTELEDGSMQHINSVGGQELVVTYTTQADASLKAVYKTAGGITLKEELTTFDATNNPTVTTKEFLGVNHTRVTVSDAETKTVVTENAGAVTKAVKDIAADKTVTTTVDAAKAVTVTEQTGTAPAVTTATGTLTVLASGQYEGQETLDLITQDAAGTVTGSKVITVYADGGERTKVFDDLGNQQSNQQVYEYHDGTVWTESVVDGVAIETYTYTNGETETLTRDEVSGATTVTQKLLVGGSLVETTKATGTTTFVDGITTQTLDLGSGEFEVRVFDNVTGIEETTFKTADGSGGFDITKVVKEERDENGNDVVIQEDYTSGAISKTVETVTSVTGTAQEKVVANGKITLTEKGVDGSGKQFEKVLGTGESVTASGVTTDTIKFTDNSTQTEKFDGGVLTERVVKDQGGDKKIDTYSGGEKVTTYKDINDSVIQASEVDIAINIGFELTDLGFKELNYEDMAVGFTAKADEFDLAVDYSNDAMVTAQGGYSPPTQLGYFPTTLVPGDPAVLGNLGEDVLPQPVNNFADFANILTLDLDLLMTQNPGGEGDPSSDGEGPPIHEVEGSLSSLYGINAVRPEYNWDDDIPMSHDFA